MNKTRILAAVVLLIFLARPAQSSPIQLYRDTWGVPHIYAENTADAAFAMGYAQAEDRLEDIYKNVRTAVGSVAEAFGPQFVQQDYIMRLVKNAERCEQYWKNAPAEITQLGDNFMRGVNAYVKEHPRKKPEYAVELAGWHCLAVARAMNLNWPLENIMNDFAKKSQAPNFGSNSFAISPSRSAEKCAILMTDPHLTWEGMAVFYEARMHAGSYDMCGLWIVGSPLPASGHTKCVSWAYTLGGPDTSDVYMLKIRPAQDKTLLYEYQNEWRPFEMQLLEIPVKGQSSEQKPALYSLYGPMIGEPDVAKGIAYCGASPYLDSVQLIEQILRMVSARNCDEFYQALAMNQLMQTNVTFADTSGNIQYVRNGCTPIRPDGYNWSVPVPGGIEKTRWLGIHKIEDLVQARNPSQGYFVNCNTSPEFMMNNSPMTPDKYKDYIYNVTWDYHTPRGERLLQLIDADTSVTKEKAMAYMTDVYDILAKPWQNALKSAVESAGDSKMTDADFAKAVKDVLAWDGQFLRESTAAPIVRFWRLKCQKKLNFAEIAAGKALDLEKQTLLLNSLADAIAEMKAVYGKVTIAWGDINLIGRDGKFFASPGVEFGEGAQLDRTETVMDVGSEEKPANSGKFIATNGSSSMLLSILRPEGVESYSLVNWGQSGDPKSPHYVDQAERLYAERKFKPTWFKKSDLMQHVESEKTLTIQ